MCFKFSLFRFRPEVARAVGAAAAWIEAHEGASVDMQAGYPRQTVGGQKKHTLGMKVYSWNLHRVLIGGLRKAPCRRSGKGFRLQFTEAYCQELWFKAFAHESGGPNGSLHVSWALLC